MKTETEKTFCCGDFKLCVTDYKKIKVTKFSIRFSGSEIFYCPFCGKKLEAKK